MDFFDQHLMAFAWMVVSDSDNRSSEARHCRCHRKYRRWLQVDWSWVKPTTAYFQH
jgi:hypothetical protein